MSTSADDIMARVNAAMVAARPNIPRPLNDMPNLDLDHQIRKVFPDVVTNFDAFRNYADSVFAIEYQRGQVGPIVTQIRLDEGAIADRAAWESAMAEFGYLDRKLTPAIEEVKRKRAALAEQKKTVAGRKLIRVRELRAQTELIERIDLLFSQIDQLVVGWKGKLGAAKYMLLDIGPKRDPNQSKIDRLKLSFSEWTATHERYFDLRMDLDASWEEVVSRTDDLRQQRLDAGDMPVQAQAASDKLKADLVLTRISELDARVEECGKEVEREEHILVQFVDGTFDTTDETHQAIAQFKRGPSIVAENLGLGLVQSLRAVGLMQ